MNGFKTALLAIPAALLTAGISISMQHEASVDKGKALFNDPGLGISGKTCSDCHREGKGIEKAAGRKDLETVVNACITGPLQGKALDPKSGNAIPVAVHPEPGKSEKEEGAGRVLMI